MLNLKLMQRLDTAELDIATLKNDYDTAKLDIDTLKKNYKNFKSSWKCAPGNSEVTTTLNVSAI